MVLLGGGGDALVRGATGVARQLGLSALFIGLVLVGFGTSLPELATSLSAALRGSPGIAIGNVVGSNIANILLILGITATLTPIALNRRAFRRDGPMLAIATAICIVFAFNGQFERVTGLVFLAVLAAYLIHTYRSEHVASDASARMHRNEADLLAAPDRPLAACLVIAFGGMGAVVLGANLLVSGSVDVAHALGIPETVIGLTVVALGTSFPELATAIAAARRRETQLAFGNVIGSNLFNILAIIGATAAIHPLRIPNNVLTYDLWIMAAVTALMLYFAVSGAQMSRREGRIFLVIYGGYMVFLGLRAGGTL